MRTSLAVEDLAIAGRPVSRWPPGESRRNFDTTRGRSVAASRSRTQTANSLAPDDVHADMRRRRQAAIIHAGRGDVKTCTPDAMHTMSRRCSHVNGALTLARAAAHRIAPPMSGCTLPLDPLERLTMRVRSPSTARMIGSGHARNGGDSMGYPHARSCMYAFVFVLATAAGVAVSAAGQTAHPAAPRHAVPPDTGVTPRARALGVPFDGTPGRWDAITDVAGVEVGEVTQRRRQPRPDGGDRDPAPW